MNYEAYSGEWGRTAGSLKCNKYLGERPQSRRHGRNKHAFLHFATSQADMKDVGVLPSMRYLIRMGNAPRPSLCRSIISLNVALARCAYHVGRIHFTL